MDKETEERFEKIGLKCPICGSFTTRTIRSTQTRFCQKCGHEWKKDLPK